MVLRHMWLEKLRRHLRYTDGKVPVLQEDRNLRTGCCLLRRRNSGPYSLCTPATSLSWLLRPEWHTACGSYLNFSQKLNRGLEERGQVNV